MSSSEDESIAPRRTNRSVKKTNYSLTDTDDDDTGSRKKKSSTEPDDNDNDDDDIGSAENSSTSAQDDDDDDMSEEPVALRKSARSKKTTTAAAASKASSSSASREPARRISSRATKTTKNMAEPTEADFRLKRSLQESSKRDDDDESPPPAKKKAAAATRKLNNAQQQSRDSLADLSPHKSPARRHAKPRLSLQHATAPSDSSFSDDETAASGNDDGEDDSSDDDDEDADDEDDLEPLHIQRIMASRTETLSKWKDVCSKMQTSEVDLGSRWQQEARTNVDADNVFEERFLIKWKGLSYLHCSWETQADMENYVEGKGKTHMTTFFRKMENGILLSADERCDGDYFDPAWTQVDRILEVELPNSEWPALTIENEDKASPSDYDIVLDRTSKDFDDGTGRQFLVKWANLPYSDSTYEFERDLILADIDYKEHLKDFIRRTTKPKTSETRELLKSGEKERRRVYKTFGEKSTIDEASKEMLIEEYKLSLQNKVFKNGGQLRDYQAEGIAWMVSNYINRRSCILADEMGLGKTLQTAHTMTIITKELCANGPVLIIAPLSTLIHWKREFMTWTDLNTIVYYGTAEDRQLIREHEFAYHRDRPDQPVGINRLYLKKCCAKKQSKVDRPWMVDVVLMTPEIAIADDSNELTAVEWECLVVDEAHRLKNHTSKLAVKLRDPKFTFNYKLLLTGTPIQNDIGEFWTLLNFIDPDQYEDADDFAEKYGDMKSKERIDELHEEIRPYILRRLKEDVEKSVPPKEETLIEIEMTVMQKQYYRALYERNVGFLNKSKKKAIDAPSLNNLAMQLRKCCNHTFLLTGVEDDIRAQKENKNIPEAELLVKASGKLVLLDKLLPRLREQGHRVLVFSQFKIMLDILEDFFTAKQMSFERIDGSITGHRRQQAIDRFQAPAMEGRDSPFIMMISTRSGGVGITLTQADTVIIVDSDWNPQSDLQAQARCHRIGQTKSVKVYRLLTRKTYEMQMFHMASLKMGLDQAILKGFEVGASGEGALTKEEVERLLRNGAYEIFKEDKEGKAEAESNDFIQQDIDSIMQRHARTVVHESAGSEGRSAAGSTFSKASFKVAKSPDAAGKVGTQDDVDVDDPDFWKKVVGEAVEVDVAAIPSQRRERTKTNTYVEAAYTEELDKALWQSDSEDEEAEDEDEDDYEPGSGEKCRWGGLPEKNEWRRADAESLVRLLATYGYDASVVGKFASTNPDKPFSHLEIRRMMWSTVFTILREAVSDAIARRRKRETEVKDGAKGDTADGGVLARPTLKIVSPEEETVIANEAFQELWNENKSWAMTALDDALSFAKTNQPRDSDTIDRALRPETYKSKEETHSLMASSFAQTWQSLKNRGWKATIILEGDKAGKTKYEHEDKQYWSHEAVIQAASKSHPDLEQVCTRILDLHNSQRLHSRDHELREREQELEMDAENITDRKLQSFLERYACLQMLHDRTKTTKISLPKRILKTCAYLNNATSFVRQAGLSSSAEPSPDRLGMLFVTDKRSKLPHPLWKSSHDAVLIMAIAKHGWIEQESSCRAIAEDTTLKWGAPFEANGTDHVAPQERPKDTDADILESAHRAALFLNSNKDILDALKGIKVEELQRVYGLVCLHDNAETSAADTQSRAFWTVDEAAVLAAQASTNSGPAVVQDLPPQRELIARAKLVLSRPSSKQPQDSAVANVAPVQVDKPVYPYAVLDQSFPCNTLLAELVRGLLKAPSQKLLPKKKALCDIARREASKRAECLKAALQAKPMPSQDLVKAHGDMERIAAHIDLVKRELTSSKTRLYKNVLKVILGEDPVSSKTEVGLFPVDKPAAPTAVLQTFAASDSRNRASGSSKTTGERAFDAASRKLFVVKRGQENMTDNALELTEVETHILRVACAVGIPVWRPDWQKQLVKHDPCVQNASGYNIVSWDDFGRLLVQVADENLVLEEGRRARVREVSNTGSIKGNSEEVLFNAEWQYKLKEDACTQARDYANDPETLAKKTIMMLPRLHRFAFRDSSAAARLKGDVALDPKVLKWMEAEVQRWSTCLDLIDHNGLPLGFTAKDFLDDVPEEDRTQIGIAACFDKQGCSSVVQQVALMSRLRNICIERGSSVSGLIRKASASLSERKWELEPSWWRVDLSSNRKDADHDTLLLKRLVDKGFDSILKDTTNFGITSTSASEISFYDLGFSKRAIQIRATLLVKALHDLVERSPIQDVIMIDDDKASITVVVPAGKKPAPLKQRLSLGQDGSSSVQQVVPPVKRERIEAGATDSISSAEKKMRST